MFRETLYRIYSTAGYNIAHIDVTAKLCEEHDIAYKDVDRVEAVVNWLETQYPSPAFPSRREDLESGPGSTSYYSAYGVVKRGFPLLKAQVDPRGADDPPEVLDLMKRVTLIPSHRMTLFGPRITVFTRDGRSYTKQATGREFIWDFDEETRRLRDVIPGLPIPAAQFEEIIATCRDLDRHAQADTLVRLDLEERVTSRLGEQPLRAREQRARQQGGLVGREIHPDRELAPGNLTNLGGAAQRHHGLPRVGERRVGQQQQSAPEVTVAHARQRKACLRHRPRPLLRSEKPPVRRRFPGHNGHKPVPASCNAASQWWRGPLTKRRYASPVPAGAASCSARRIDGYGASGRL